jgi:hypothetical protein
VGDGTLSRQPLLQLPRAPAPLAAGTSLALHKHSAIRLIHKALSKKKKKREASYCSRVADTTAALATVTRRGVRVWQSGTVAAVIARARVPHLSRSLRMMNTTSDRAHDDDAAVHAAAASAVVDNNIRKFLLVCPQTLEAFRCVFFLFMCTINLCSPCHMPHTRTPVHQVARRAHHTSAHNETKRLHKDSFPFGSCIGATLTRSLFAQLPAPTPIARKHTHGAQTPRD